MNYIRHKIFLLISDILLLTLVIFIAFQILYVAGIDFIPYHPVLLFTFSGTVLIIGSYINNQYRYDVVLDKPLHSISILKSFLGSYLLLLVLVIIIRPDDVYHQLLYYFLVMVLQCIAFIIFRVFMVPGILFLLVKWNLITRNILIIGVYEEAKKIARHIRNANGYYIVKGYLSLNGIQEEIEPKEVPFLGSLNALTDSIQDYRIHDIFIAGNELTYQQVSDTTEICKGFRKVIHIVSYLYDVVPRKVDLEHFGGIGYYRIKPSVNISLYILLKRSMDFLLSGLLIIILLPFAGILALLIRSGSPGPVFFSASVIGKDGVPFRWYKFRSMRANNSDQDHRTRVNEVIKYGQVGHKLHNDPRVTRIGKFLRQYSLDELPQLYNVLKGEMSLVGPRPKLQYEFELMEGWQKDRFSAVPGLTGLFQIKAKNDVRFNEEIVIDQYYIENRSLKIDIEIILKTIPFILGGKNK